MTIPFALPDWIPWWGVVLVLVPVVLYALAFLAMPFSVLGLKGRLDSLDARLDEVQGEVRALALRLPERGMYLSEAPRPPIPPAPRERYDQAPPEPHERYDRAPRAPEPRAFEPRPAPSRAATPPVRHSPRPPEHDEADEAPPPDLQPSDLPPPDPGAAPHGRRVLRAVRGAASQPASPSRRTPPRLDWPR